MAGFYKRPYSNRKKSSSLKSRTSSQFKKAKTGNDSFSFVCNTNYVFSAAYDTNTRYGVAAIPIWNVLANNANFQHFASSYDQVRLDGVRVKLSVTDAQTSINNYTQVKNTTIFCAWDRTGLSLPQVEFFKTKADGSPDYDHPIDISQYDTEATGGFRIKIGDGIVNATGVDKSILNNFQRWQKYLYNYPNLLAEKAQYVPTGSIEKVVQSVNWQTASYNISNKWQLPPNLLMNTGNPCSPLECNTLRYKPVLLVGVFNNQLNTNTGDIVQYGSCSPVIFNAEFSISLTFKDMKAAR